MRLTLTMELGNAAFMDGGIAEVKRAINAALARLDDPPAIDDSPIIDAKGNQVGTVTITEPEL